MKHFSKKTNRPAFLVAAVAMLLGLLSCDRDEMYRNEMYKPVIYLLSGSDNTYTWVYPFSTKQTVEGYFSIGCGGSRPNAEPVSIELEPDTVLFDKYNRNHFDIDSASFARILSPERYVIPSYTVTLPANSPDQYVRVPVSVRTEGLSPDSIYFIPLAVKSVSNYEVNPEKYNLLFRVAIENDYAEQINTTYYYQKGTRLEEISGEIFPVNGSKTVQPVAIDKVRMFAGTYTQLNTTSPEDIRKYAIVVQVNADQSLKILPFGTIQVQQIDLPDWNKYAVEGTAGKEKYRFYLSYRFRTALTPGSASTSETWSEWQTMKETLERLGE
jgi:hypothetical protein